MITRNKMRHVPVESIAMTSACKKLTRKQHAIHAACDSAGRHITTDGKLLRTQRGGVLALRLNATAYPDLQHHQTVILYVRYVYEIH